MDCFFSHHYLTYKQNKSLVIFVNEKLRAALFADETIETGDTLRKTPNYVFTFVDCVDTCSELSRPAFFTRAALEIKMKRIILFDYQSFVERVSNT